MATTEKKKAAEEVQLPAVQASSTIPLKEIQPLRLILPASAISAILASTYLTSKVGFVQPVSPSFLPAVERAEQISVDLTVAFNVSPLLLSQLVEGCGIIDDEEADEDDEDEDEEDEKPTKRKGEGVRAFKKRLKAWEAEQDAKDEDVKFAGTGGKPYTVYEIDDGIELSISNVNPGEAVLLVREAYEAEIPGDEEGSTSIRESAEYRAIAGKSAGNAEQLENYLSSLGKLIEQMGAEDQMVSLSGLEDDSLELNTQDAKAAATASLREAGSVEQKRAERRRNELAQTYADRIEKLGKILFGKAGAPVKLKPSDAAEYGDAVDSAIGSAMYNIIADVG